MARLAKDKGAYGEGVARFQVRHHSGFNTCTHTREQGWCSGEITRRPTMWAGFNSQTWRHM